MSDGLGRAPSGQATQATPRAGRPSRPSGERPSREKAWPLGRYAPGNYFCRCTDCGEEFEGDKRALECLECAVRNMNALFTATDRALRIMLWNEEKRRGAHDGPAMRAMAERLEAIRMEARQGRDPKGLDGEAATAGAEGIAQPQVGDSNP